MQRISNPIAHLDSVGHQPTEKQKAKAKEQAKIQRRVAQFEAQRAQEDSMEMVDMNPGAPQQSTMNRVTVPKRSAAELPPSPIQPTMQRPPVVQKVARTPEPSGPSNDSDIFKEMEAEFSAPEEAVGEAPEAADDFDPQAILKRYKGTPEEVARQLAKSYANSEKRMRQLESEKNLLVQQGFAPQQAAPQAPVQHAPAPVQQQVQVTPAFDYKKWGDTLLDSPAERAQEMDKYIRSSVKSELANELIGPMAEAILDIKLAQKFPEISDESLDVIKAMAYKEPGLNRWEKVLSAATKYKGAMPTVKPQVNHEVEAMQQAAQQPSPQARVVSGDKKMWKASDLRKEMQKPAYRSDPAKRAMIDRAYAEGRVLRGQ